MDFKKIDIKKALLVVFAVLVGVYVVWDISVRVVTYFRLQGYEIAVMEVIRQAENEDCEPFGIYVGEKTLNLIDVACLQPQGADENFEIGEDFNFEDFQIE